MTNDTTPEMPDPIAPADEAFGFGQPEVERPDRTAQAREWLGQLQSMIEQLAEQAGPVVREIGIKAAELAVKAGEKAGPMAHRAAEFTESAGQRLADRSRDLATELRRDQAAHVAEAAEAPEQPEPVGTAPGA